ncbi:hypothetical protein THAOC_01888, partial [Thalassiosira oceanica]
SSDDDGANETTAGSAAVRAAPSATPDDARIIGLSFCQRPNACRGMGGVIDDAAPSVASRVVACRHNISLIMSSGHLRRQVDGRRLIADPLGGADLSFKIRNKTRMPRVFVAYASRHFVEAESVAADDAADIGLEGMLCFETTAGVAVSGDDTAHSPNLHDGDTLRYIWIYAGDEGEKERQRRTTWGSTGQLPGSEILRLSALAVGCRAKLVFVMLGGKSVQTPSRARLETDAKVGAQRGNGPARTRNGKCRLGVSCAGSDTRAAARISYGAGFVVNEVVRYLYSRDDETEVFGELFSLEDASSSSLSTPDD